MPHCRRFGLNGSGWELEHDEDMLKSCLGGLNIQLNICSSVFYTERCRELNYLCSSYYLGRDKNVCSRYIF